MKALLTCPECGNRQYEVIPERKCIPFYRCRGCKALIAAKRKCCVFCEFSDTRCPVAHVTPG